MTAGLVDFVDYLADSKIPIRLACRTESGWPVVISLWYLYQDGLLYCATREGAKIVSYLKSHSKCAFEIAADTPPYCGIRGQARAEINQDLGLDILKQLIQRYLGGEDNSLAQKLLMDSADEVAIVIKPINVFSWNFTTRMEEIAPVMMRKIVKVCP